MELCFIRKCPIRHFQGVDCARENTICFNLSIIPWNKKNLLLCTYAPPLGSPFYASKDSSDGIKLLGWCMLYLEEKYEIICLYSAGTFKPEQENTTS